MPWPCGAADFVDKFSIGLAKAGHAVTIVTSNPQARREEGRRNVKIIPGDWGISHVLRISGWIREERFDVVDLQYEAAMYSRSAQVLSLPWLLGRRQARVLSLHSQDLPALGGRWWRPVQLFPHDAVVFYSHHFRQAMSRRFPQHAAKFHVQGFPANIVRGANPDIQSLLGKIKAGLVGSPTVILYFGHIGPYRGIEGMLEVLERLGDKRLRPRLVLASQFTPEENSYHRDLLSAIEARGLEEQVAFPGRLDDREVSFLFEAADICVLPFPEGASFKNGSLAAAIDHCVPTVTTVSLLTEHELVESGALQTYAPGNTQDLERILEGLLKNPHACADLRTKMRAMRNLVSWEAYIDRRLDIYEDACRTVRESNGWLC